jgi:tetraacyldisaccharide 4'-kinase
MAAHLAKALADRGLRPALVTKGYRRKLSGPMSVGESTVLPAVSDVGDEAMMLWRETGLPVHVDDDPAEAIARLDTSQRYDTIIFDDGVSRSWHQERRIMALTSADCMAPVRHLPYGRWRVSPRMIARATGVAVVDSSAPSTNLQEAHTERIHSWGFDGPIGWYRTGLVGYSLLGEDARRDPQPPQKGRPLVFCGLGMPSRFMSHLAGSGIAPGGQMFFPDHHGYTEADLRLIEQRCADSRCDWILTTHKDAVKINAEWITACPIYYLRMTLELVAGDDMVAVVTEGM